MPDTLKGIEAFGIDHYRPRNQFPQLAVSYSNLFYCCNACNARKGPFWPTRAQAAAGVFVPNPVEHEMVRHLKFRRAEVTDRSKAGSHAIKLLDLNDPVDIQYRDFVLQSIATNRLLRRKLRKTTSELSVLLANDPGSKNAGRIRAGLESTSKRLTRVENALRMLCGEFTSTT